VQGPVAIGGGEELVLNVTITNNNNVPLEGAELFIEYPSGTREASDVSVELLRFKKSLGPIASKESVTKTVKAVLFGKKNSIKNIWMSVDYKPEGSNSVFTKEKSYEIVIKSAPILFSVDYPKEVNSSQTIEFDLTITSNSNTLIEDVLLQIDYPFGFEYKSATPLPSFDTNVWSIGDLNPREERVIKLTGVMTGQNDEEKTFRFNAGTAALNDEKNIGVNFIAIAESVLIRKPFFSLNLSLDGDTSEQHVTSIDEMVRGELLWTNNLPLNINDVIVDIVFGGNALNRNTVLANQQGFYQSISNTITWDKRVFPKLAEIGQGESGMFAFDFDTIKATPDVLATLRNPEVNLDVFIQGTRFTETQPPEKITYTFSRNVKVTTEAVFNPRVVYSVGPFKNSGPIPPRAEQPTTYTVFWTLSNSFNDLGNTSVSAALPPYVTWVGTKSPLGEQILYNQATNKIVWEPGEIKAGVGFTSSPREVAFQVSFLPSLGQVGNAPVLIEQMTFTGLDRFTGKEISVTKQPLTTRIATDPEFYFTDDVVVE